MKEFSVKAAVIIVDNVVAIAAAIAIRVISFVIISAAVTPMQLILEYC